MPEVDPSFRALPLSRMADAALDRARRLGADHADFRLERITGAEARVRDNRLQGASQSEDLGFAVRVVHDGTWGFAASDDLSAEAAARVAELAVDAARTSRPLSSERVELAAEPVHAGAAWVSAYEINPLDVPEVDRVAALMAWSEA